MIDAIAAPPDRRWHFGAIESTYLADQLPDDQPIIRTFAIRENNKNSVKIVALSEQIKPTSNLTKATSHLSEVDQTLMLTWIEPKQIGNSETRIGVDLYPGIPDQALLLIDRCPMFYLGLLERMAMQAAVNRKLIVDRQSATERR